MSWEPYAGEAGHTVVGDLRIRSVASPQLGGAPRDLLAWLPPSHGGGRLFPVVVMHDAPNLFDVATSNGAEWRVDETLAELAGEGLEAIVVGVPHGADRGAEYAGDMAEAYLDFLAETVLPLVRWDFDVDPRREATGIAGSSLGGVISLHGLYAYPDTVGFSGVLSPAFWWNDDRLFETVERDPAPPARIYLDVGDREDLEDEKTRRAYLDGFERMAALLRRKGLGEDDLLTVLDEGGLHHETAWAGRLPDALRFLLKPFSASGASQRVDRREAASR